MSAKKRPLLPGGELELAILTALWELGEVSAREVHKQVGEPRKIVYTTVAKVLDRLAVKGMVRRRRAGRVYVYRAVVEREDTQRAMARGFLERLAKSGARPAAAALIGALEDVSTELLKAFAAEINNHRRRQRKRA